MVLIHRVGTVLAIVAALSAATFAQEHQRSEPAGGPFSSTLILDAPFSAEANAKVREALSNGTIREHARSWGNQKSPRVIDARSRSTPTCGVLIGDPLTRFSARRIAQVAAAPRARFKG